MKIILLKLLVTEVVILGTSDVTRVPAGPMLCVELCQTLGRCSNPRFGVDHLLCVLEYTNNSQKLTELPELPELPEYKWTQNICTEISVHNKRQIISRSGRKLCVLEGRREGTRVSATDNPPKKMDDMVKFKFNPLFKFRRCRVNSMTPSEQHPGHIYLLIRCSQGGCPTYLLVANMRSLHLTNKAISLCTKSEKRHIFTGPCVKTNNPCLYSVNLGRQWQLITHREPNLTTTSIETDVRTNPKRCFDKNAVCANSGNHTVLCFVRNTVKTISIIYISQKNEYRMEVVRTHWQYQPIICNAKAMTYNPGASQYIIVNVSHVNLLTADVPKMEIRKKWSTYIYRGYSLTMVGNSVLLSSNYLGQSFYLCPFNNLRGCIQMFITF